jgi:hypothetical protein
MDSDWPSRYFLESVIDSVRSTGKPKIALLNTCRQKLRGVFIGHATWRPLLICFQLPHSHFLNPLLVIKARQAFTYLQQRFP